MGFPNDLELLRLYFDRGMQYDFYFFYGHKKPKSGVDSSCLSQWFDCGFEIDGIHFKTAEHWMMFGKAQLFHDNYHADLIVEAPDPKTAKALGRQVRGFSQDIWNTHRVEIVTRGNLAKFEQNPDLNKFLQSTRGRILVEAAGRDTIWGIGLSATNPKAQDPRLWRGQNLLGFILTDVRDRLRT